MRIYTFIYIISNFLILQLVSLESAGVNQLLHIVCGLGIVTLGIAHGSLDNILYGVDSKKSNRVFLFFYVVLIMFFVGLWVLSTNVAFIVFMVISAYHFGQSQFEDYKLSAPIFNKILYFLWGGIVLFLPLALSRNELVLLKDEINEFIPILNVLVQYSLVIILSLGALFIVNFIALLYHKTFRKSDLLKEVYIFILLVVSFKLLPPFIAFSLFFVFIHSLKVIIQEYEFCSRNAKVESVIQFVKLCLPLTMVSVLGICLISAGLYYFKSSSFIPFALVLALSAITFPHSLVMERFYTHSDKL